MQSLFFVVFVAVIKTSLCQVFPVDTFEFGVNEGRVAYTTSGNIGLLEKTVRIPIVIPECSTLTYVRVDVDNKLGPPTVTFDSDLSTVIIHYRLLQYSISAYTITVKTVPNNYCQSS